MVVTSCWLAGTVWTTSGVPVASVSTQCLLPERPRSVGFGPVLVRPAGLSPDCNRPATATNPTDPRHAAWPGTTRGSVTKCLGRSTRRSVACKSCTKRHRLPWEGLSSRCRSSARTTRPSTPSASLSAAARHLAMARTRETTARSRFTTRRVAIGSTSSSLRESILSPTRKDIILHQPYQKSQYRFCPSRL